MKKNFYLIILTVFFMTIDCWSAGAQTTDGLSSTPGWYQTLSHDLNFRANVVGYALFQNVEESGLNPYNILGIPQRRLGIELRPDFSLPLNRLEFGFKPRATLYHTHWDDGIYETKRDESDSDVYVNEGLVKLRIADRFFVSAGRENLQWGPSYLLSPSNPFYQDNGRNNPSLELPGLDYLRAVWIPSLTWTLSGIANIGKGRADSIRDFKNGYALKLDFTGDEKYFSLIGSCREDEKAEVGFFGGMTLADPLLVYTEGSMSAEEEAVDILVGGAYTLTDGSTVSVEYFHHGAGCTKEPIESCLISENDYQNLMNRFSIFTGTIDQLLDEIDNLNLGDQAVSFVRKNYFLLQYIKPRIRDTLTLTARWICDLDDTSSRAIGMVNYELNNYWEAFAVGNLYLGGSDIEDGSLLNHSVMMGLICSF